MCPSRERSESNSSSFWRPWKEENENKLYSQTTPSSLFQCSICLTRFKRESELRRHKNSKHLSKREKCMICNQIFTRKDNLTRHIKAHSTSDKPSCQFCKKRLSRRDAVQRHESRCPKNKSRKLSSSFASSSSSEDKQTSFISRQIKEEKDEQLSGESSSAIMTNNGNPSSFLFHTHLQRLSLKHPKVTDAL